MANPARVPNRRLDILEKSGHLFAAHGYEGTAIRQIARTCGITEAAIYRHFDSKLHLYEEVIRHKAGEFDIRGHLASKRGSGDVASALHTVAEHILGISAQDPELVRLMFFNTLEGYRVSTVLFQELRYPYIQFLRQELTERVASGEIREIDPYITARCFVGMVMDCALNVNIWRELDKRDLSAETVICNNVPIFARGLAV